MQILRRRCCGTGELMGGCWRSEGLSVDSSRRSPTARQIFKHFNVLKHRTFARTPLLHPFGHHANSSFKRNLNVRSEYPLRFAVVGESHLHLVTRVEVSDPALLSHRIADTLR